MAHSRRHVAEVRHERPPSAERDVSTIHVDALTVGDLEAESITPVAPDDMNVPGPYSGRPRPNLIDRHTPAGLLGSTY